MRIVLATLLTVTVAGCIGDPDAPDTSEAAQASTTVFTSCVDSTHPYNAEIDVDDYPGAFSSYTRTPAASCDAHTTVVDMLIGPPPPVSPGFATDALMASYVESGTWGLESTFTTAQKKTECENSTLAMRVLDNNGNQLYYAETHPNWLGTECGSAVLRFDRPSGNNSQFTVRALAIRGLEQYHHGYARVQVYGAHQYVSL